MDRIEVMNLVTSYQLGKMSRRKFLQRASLAVGSVAVANVLAACTLEVPENAPAPQLLVTPPAAGEVGTPLGGAGGRVSELITYADKAGVVGYCMGGGLALQAAVVSDRVGAAVPYYGTLLTPEEAVQVKAPIQAHYGTEDRFDLNALEEMVQIVQDETGLAAEAYIYEGAPHAFFNDERADAYRPEAAADAWERTLTWFNTYLG